MFWWVVLATVVVVPLYGIGTFALFLTHVFAYDAPDFTMSKLQRVGRPVVLTALWLAWLGIGAGFVGWCIWMLGS